MKKVFVANPSRKRRARSAQKKTRRGRNPLPLVIGNPRRIHTMSAKKRRKAGAERMPVLVIAATRWCVVAGIIATPCPLPAWAW